MSPIIINTVDDLLRILAERGLGSVPPSPAPSTTPQEDTSFSDTESEISTLISTPLESDFERESGQLPEIAIEVVEEAVKSIRKKLDLPINDRTVREVHALLSYLSAPRRKVLSATAPRRGHVDAACAIDRARHASLKRFLAYHDHREKECDFEGNVGANGNKVHGATQWATVTPIFEGKAPQMNASAILKESIKLNKPPMRVRKPIPTWF